MWVFFQNPKYFLALLKWNENPKLFSEDDVASESREMSLPLTLEMLTKEHRHLGAPRLRIRLSAPGSMSILPNVGIDAATSACLRAMSSEFN